MRILDNKNLFAALSLTISIVWLIVSGLEMLIAFLNIGKQGIDSFFVIETVIIALIAICLFIFVLIKKKNNYKLLSFNLLLLAIGMIALFAQFFSPTLSSTMPHRYLTIGNVYGIFYRIDVMQSEENLDTILKVCDSLYIVNLNLILSTTMVVINAIFYNKRSRDYVETEY